MTTAEKQQVREILAPLEHMAEVRTREGIRQRLDHLAKSLQAGERRAGVEAALRLVDGEGAK